MKKLIFLIFSLAVFTKADAQQGKLDIWEMFSESYPMPANYKTLNVDQLGSYTVSASILPITHASSFPEQKCGPLKIFALNFLMGNPYRWEINANGNIFPFDIKITKDNNTIITGAFLDSFHVENYSFQSNPFIASSFVMSVNNFGQINWVKLLQDSVFNTIATSITELESGNIVLTALTNDIESTIWKLNAKSGTVISTKTLNEIRTLSSIVEVNNFIYVAGSSGDFSHLDSFIISSSLNTGYVNFLAKLDTNLFTLNLKCEPYVTFDFTSHVELNPQSNNIIWAYYFTNSNQQFKQGFNIYNDRDGLLQHYETSNINDLAEFNNRLTIPKIRTGMFYVIQKHQNNYYAYDLSDAIVDSALLISNSEASMYDVACDSANGFTTVGVFSGDSLRTSINILFNPNADSLKTQNFLSHYFEYFVGIDNQKISEVKVYPNPATDVLTIDLNGIEKIEIYNLQGKLVEKEFYKNKILINQLPSGMYLLKVNTLNKNYVTKFIKK